MQITEDPMKTIINNKKEQFRCEIRKKIINNHLN